MNFKKSVLQFSIRKLSIGVASIAIGSIFMNASIASANTIAPSKANTSTNSIVQPKEMNQNNQIQPTIGTKQTQNNENNKGFCENYQKFYVFILINNIIISRVRVKISSD